MLRRGLETSLVEELVLGVVSLDIACGVGVKVTCHCQQVFALVRSRDRPTLGVEVLLQGLELVRIQFTLGVCLEARQVNP